MGILDKVTTNGPTAIDVQSAVITVGEFAMYADAAVEVVQEAISEIDITAIVTAACGAERAKIGATRTAAIKVNMEIGEKFPDWYESKSDDKQGTAGAAFEPFRVKIRDTAKARNHSNPAQFVREVKAAGRELVEGKPEAKKKDGNPSRERHPFERFEIELTTLINASSECSSAKTTVYTEQYKLSEDDLENLSGAGEFLKMALDKIGRPYKAKETS
jgi:hypothetical protein